MARTKVTIINSEKLASQQLSLVKKMANEDIEKIAIETQKRLQYNILASIQRPGSTGNLAKSVTVEKIPNGWGVGNIASMDILAPYWRWINFGRAKSGRTVPPPVGGYFDPTVLPPSQALFRQGRFVKDSNTYFINPQNPIQAHNFIARTLQSLNNIISGILRLRRKI